MNKYTKTTYVNDSSPYLSAENLNHSEDGIEAVTDGLIDLQAVVDTKADKSELEAYARKDDIPDVSVYAKTADVEATYAKKTDIPDTSTLATKEALEQAETSLESKINTKADETELDTKADKSDLDAKADKSALDAKADKTEIPTTLPTPNAFKMTVNGTTYTFDGSSEVVITLEDASGKEF
jgi:hypothetical protein